MGHKHKGCSSLSHFHHFHYFSLLLFIIVGEESSERPYSHSISTSFDEAGQPAGKVKVNIIVDKKNTINIQHKYSPSYELAQPFQLQTVLRQ